MPAIERAERRDAKRKSEPRRNVHEKSARRRQLKRSAMMRLAAIYARAA
jgi:hypothetical protein